MAAFQEVGAGAEEAEPDRGDWSAVEQLEGGGLANKTADLREIRLWLSKVQPCFLRKQSWGEPP